jgi:hypothetical protein
MKRIFIPQLSQIQNKKFEEKNFKNIKIKLDISNLHYIKNVLRHKNGEEICKVLKNGKVSDGIDELSIHDMPEKFIGRRMNGWEWFFVKRDGKLKSINQIILFIIILKYLLSIKIA